MPTKKTKKQKKDDIKILSYNISWESMTGEKPDWELCSNNKDVTSDKHFSVCVTNIADVINKHGSDFVVLQEASNWENLIKLSPRLQTMKFAKHVSGMETMITFWTTKYKLEDIIKGEFEKGRPWLATIFKGGLCIVNVHFGHYDTTNTLYMQKLRKCISTIKNALNNKHMIKVIRFIIAGDFNCDIKKLQPILTITKNLKLHYNKKHLLTCCVKRNHHYDHVIDSKKAPKQIKILNVDYMASDHKPILGTVSV